MSDRTSLPATLSALHEESPGLAPEAQSDDVEEAPPVYGYGHPAHRPDPDAAYVFRPGPPRTLPLNPRRRWRTSG